MIGAVSRPPHHDRGDLGDAIDLGESRWDAEEAGAPWRPPAWVSATGKVVALALVALGTVSAASTPAIPQLGEPLWSARVAWDSFSLGRDLVYLRDGQHAIVARDARTGVEVWRREVSGNPMSVSEVGSDLTTIFNSVRSTTGESWSTVFVDPATGQVLGEREATTAVLLVEGATPAEDRVLLYGSQEAASTECPEGQCGELALIDPPSLEPLWRFVTRRQERLVAAFGANGGYDTTDAFALLTQDGRATIFEAPSSWPALTVDVGPGATNGVLTRVSLIVASRRGQHMVVTAYDRVSGNRRW
jgi:outer membrane protein assembly factor BamB